MLTQILADSRKVKKARYVVRRKYIFVSDALSRILNETV